MREEDIGTPSNYHTANALYKAYIYVTSSTTIVVNLPLTSELLRMYI